jgi:hypothetical protein
MIPPELDKIPATKADILRLEEKLDAILGTEIKWIKRSISGAYVGLLALFGMK